MEADCVSEPRSVLSTFCLRYEKSSLLEGCGVPFHSARIAAMASSASFSLGAAAATKSPSWTTTADGNFCADVTSQEVIVAPKEGERRTFPYMRPAGRRSEGYWWRPVTNARPSTFGSDLPAIVHADGRSEERRV